MNATMPMLPILRFLALSALMSFPAVSMAIYKCEENGKIVYSDEKCGGKVTSIDVEFNSRISPSAASEATARGKQEKEKLKHLEEARRKEEILEEKSRQKQLRASEVLRKKCQNLALKVKWSEEDAAAAVGKSAEKMKRTATRNREKYETECGKY